MDRQARFEQLYRAHAGAVRAYAVRRARSDAIADDVVSDVFLVVWRRLDDVPDRPVPWLLLIARRALANRRRSGRRAAALRLTGSRAFAVRWRRCLRPAIGCWMRSRRLPESRPRAVDAGRLGGA